MASKCEAGAPGEGARSKGGAEAMARKDHDGRSACPASGYMNKEDEIAAHARCLSSRLAGIPYAAADLDRGPSMGPTAINPPDGLQVECKDGKTGDTASAQTPAGLLAHNPFLEDCPFEGRDGAFTRQDDGFVICALCDPAVIYKLGETAIGMARWCETNRPRGSKSKRDSCPHNAENRQRAQAATAPAEAGDGEGVKGSRKRERAYVSRRILADKRARDDRDAVEQ